MAYQGIIRMFTPIGVASKLQQLKQLSQEIGTLHENGTIRWTNVPRQPIPKLDDVSLWIGHQLNYERMPAKYQHMAPEGELLASIEGYPEGLLISHTE
jgi:hypothetical protein